MNPAEYISTVQNIHNKLDEVSDQNDRTYIRRRLEHLTAKDYFEINYLKRNIGYGVDSQWEKETLDSDAYKDFKKIIDAFNGYLDEIKERYEIVFPRCKILLRELTGATVKEVGLAFMPNYSMDTTAFASGRIGFSLEFFKLDANERNSVLAHEIFHIFAETYGRGKIYDLRNYGPKFIFTTTEAKNFYGRSLLDCCRAASKICFKFEKIKNIPALKPYGINFNKFADSIDRSLKGGCSFNDLYSMYRFNIKIVFDRLRREFKEFENIEEFRLLIGELDVMTSGYYEEMMRLLGDITTEDVAVLTGITEEGFACAFAKIYSHKFREKYAPHGKYSIYAHFATRALELFQKNPKIFKIFMNEEKLKELILKFKEILKNDTIVQVKYVKQFHGL